MKVEVQKSFEKDIEKIHDKKLAVSVETIIEALEKCNHLLKYTTSKK